MCRIAAAPRVNNENREQVWEFMKLLGQYMSVGNNDGLGYAAFDSAGKIFGERWLVNKLAFMNPDQIKGMNEARLKASYSFFGEEVKRDEAQAILLHTRFATCERGIKNTHPFVDDYDNPKAVIIHNGVISNHRKFLKKYSTCDSEVIVHLYKQLQVAEDFDKIKEVMDELDGWFTVLGLSTDATGRMVMDAFTDSSRLNSYFVPELQTRIFSTVAGDIIQTADKLGMSLIDPKQIASNSAFRLDAVTGELIKENKYTYTYNAPNFNVHDASQEEWAEFFERWNSRH